jgi:hypothetical protein
MLGEVIHGHDQLQHKHFIFFVSITIVLPNPCPHVQNYCGKHVLFKVYVALILPNNICNCDTKKIPCKILEIFNHPNLEVVFIELFLCRVDP